MISENVTYTMPLYYTIGYATLRYVKYGYSINPLKGKDNYIATSNNMQLVHWLLMGGLLHLVQRGEDWAGPQPAQAPPRCTKIM